MDQSKQATRQQDWQLFEDLVPPCTETGAARPSVGAELSEPARVLQADRLQVELRAWDLESLLPEDHRARLVWHYVARQDLQVLFDAIKARGSAPGRRAIDPRILFSLWLYATLDGVASGREVARLSQSHDAYRWICGGVSVNYHALNDFRSANEALMDTLLTHNVAALAAAGVVRLVRVAQDGMRVRASAGAASFRRKGTLKEHHAKASEMVKTLKEDARSDPGQASRKAQAAKLRAAQQREQRLAEALARLPELEAIKQRNSQPVDKARTSTTDADASNMKMADGGYRPAYNVQLATDCDSQVIVGVDTVTAGSDMAQLEPMVEQVHKRLGKTPRQWLVDGGYPAHGQIDAVADKTEVYAPVPCAKPAKRKDQDRDPPAPPAAAEPGSEYQPKPGDSSAVAQWRQRMGTEQAREIYKDRAATAECVNAQARNRGLLRMPVRGLAKVKCVVWLYALAHNLMRTAALAPQLIGWGAGVPAAAATRA